LPSMPFCGIWMTICGPQERLEAFFSSDFSC